MLSEIRLIMAGGEAFQVTGTGAFDFKSAASLRFLKAADLDAPPPANLSNHPPKSSRQASTKTVLQPYFRTAVFSFPRCYLGPGVKYEMIPSKISRRSFRPHHPAKSQSRSPHIRPTSPSRATRERKT